MLIAEAKKHKNHCTNLYVLHLKKWPTDSFFHPTNSKWLLGQKKITRFFFSVRVPPNRRRTTRATTTTTTTTTGTPTTTTSVDGTASVENTRTTPPPNIFVDGFIVGNLNRNENDNALVRNENTRPNLANLDDWAWMDPERQDALVSFCRSCLFNFL